MCRVGGWPHVGLLLAMVAATAGCATRIDAQAVTNASGQPAWELRGSSLQVLLAEAHRLCPNGPEVLRQWQRHERDESESGSLRRWTLDVVDAPRSQAQMQVVCRA